ncbi:hypothetical protein H0H92_000850 [Tricholoma furcatifolium]|nr:hypothetical protein H0H92_000850 [Tricholoma furcatifolium]
MYSLFIVPFISLISLVAAIPRFNNAVSRETTISSLVGTGATFVEALIGVGGREKHDTRTHYLTSTSDPGYPGNLTVQPDLSSPPLFYVHQNQLWQYINETSILAVNTINATKSSPFPYQLVADTKRDGVNHATWRWRGTVLYYDQGAAGSSNIFYDCRIPGGTNGVFMALKGVAKPVGCRAFTMHTWSRSHINPHTEL